MRHKLLLTGILFLCLFSPSAYANEDIEVLIQPSVNYIEVGQYYTLDIVLSHTANIQAVDITVKLKGNGLQLVDENDVDISVLNVNSDLHPLVLLNHIDHLTNELRFAATWDKLGTNDNIVIATLPFRAVSEDSFSFDVTRCTVVENMKMKQISIQPVVINPQLTSSGNESIHNRSTQSKHKSASPPMIKELPTVQDFSKVQDVSEDIYQWAYPAIRFMVEKGVIPLEENNIFNPDKFVTKAEFNSYLTKLFTINTLTTYAQQNNIITRYEAVKIIVDTLDIPKPSMEETEQILLKFNDTHDLSDSQKQIIVACIKHNILVGYKDNTLRSHNALTRAETAVILMRIYFR